MRTFKQILYSFLVIYDFLVLLYRARIRKKQVITIWDIIPLGKRSWLRM